MKFYAWFWTHRWKYRKEIKWPKPEIAFESISDGPKKSYAWPAKNCKDMGYVAEIFLTEGSKVIDHTFRRSSK